MKPTESSIRVELKVLYYSYETRPQACHECCPQLQNGACVMFGRLELQRMPGRWRYSRHEDCIAAED